MNFTTIEDKVTYLLDTYPETRKSDHSLIAAWLYVFEGRKDLSESMLKIKHETKCNFETIRRCRQKAQEKHPELTDRNAQTIRREQEEAYRQYALEG